jgi:hypothetical protein
MNCHYTCGLHVHLFTSTLPVLCLTYSEVLDPHISYDGMKLDYEDDISLTEYLESAKLSLHTYFLNNYAGKHVAPSHSSFAHSSATTMWSHLDGSPQKVNLTVQYWKAPQALVDELEEYFKLPHEDFETCDPIKWWLGCCSQFPNLFVLAHDLLAITDKLSIPLSHLQAYGLEW